MPALNVRGIDREVMERIHKAARVRGITIAQYLTRLEALHDHAKARAVTDTDLAGELRVLGLETVTA